MSRAHGTKVARTGLTDQQRRDRFARTWTTAIALGQVAATPAEIEALRALRVLADKWQCRAVGETHTRFGQSAMEYIYCGPRPVDG